MPARKSIRNAGSSAKHAFVKRRDERSALALGAVHLDLNQVGVLALVDASLREHPCALPGCGKPKDDPIHDV
jgi:hypothetical protein